MSSGRQVGDFPEGDFLEVEESEYLCNVIQSIVASIDVTPGTDDHLHSCREPFEVSTVKLPVSLLSMI